ncbi:serine protease [Glycomyces halotolerans]
MRRMSIAALAGATALGSVALGAAGAQADPVAEVLGADAPDAVPGEYIVVMASEYSTMSAEYDADIVDRYDFMNGYLAEMSAEEAAKIAADDAVAFVEQNQTVSIADTQTNPTWGLDRIDQRDLPLDNAYTYVGDGSGVTAYIVDTGIRASHNEFSGRVGAGYDFVDGDSNPNDCNGHGTHVAGTVAGSTYGVAKAATVVGVRVLDCAGSGTFAGVIDGIEWVADNASGPSTANMSLGGGYSSAINSAVAAAVDAGVSFVVAAGNEGQNACNTSPASEPKAITVGATDSGDRKASWSNYGGCLDVFAPGVSITSAWYTSNGATNTISGTSMASPHVAGAATAYLSDHPSASPAQVASWVGDNATPNKVSGAGSGSPNLLLYTGEGGGTDPDPVDPGCSGTYDGPRSLPDRSDTTSYITIDCDGSASSAVVDVDISHTWRGDLRIYLVAPDGSSYQLKDSGWDSGNDVVATYNVSLGNETASGDWGLRVVDVYSGDSGTLNSWSIEL